MIKLFCQNHEKVLGSLGAVLAIVMFVALVEVFSSNLRGDSAILIQPLATALNCTVWCGYAYGRNDWFLFWPNALGVFLGIITVFSVFL